MDPFLYVQASQITLKPGQTFTVWLDRETDPGKRNAEQVELRVTPDGCLEIYIEKNGRVAVREFEAWKPM